ncbi:MAG: UvrD-helicase domain-containing protein [Clostridia bacterium]|nr:UvrD-helicase domain-containing protein [Clostridia bacterium]
MPQWTKEQQQAIDARNHTILVSAAAGSGKTAVLIERIVRLIEDGYTLDRMMICTFTRAAAAEMRQRLQKRITEEMKYQPELMGKALDDLESAQISTIHSFCQKILRSEFQAAQIDPLSSICNDAVKENLFQEAVNLAMNELLESEDEDFRFMAEQLDQKTILEWNKKLHGFLMSLPDPFAWLNEAVEQVDAEPIQDQPWYRVILTNMQIQLHAADGILNEIADMFQLPDAVEVREPVFEADHAMIGQLLSVPLDDGDAFIQALENVKFARMNSWKAKDAT